MSQRILVRSILRRAGLSVAVLCAVLGLHGATASAQECRIRYPFGTVELPLSDYRAETYGADLGLLYGKWEWRTTFDLHVNVAKALLYVRDIAGLARHCIGDVRRGRLDFAPRRVTDGQSPTPRDETDEEYFERVLENLVDIRREFAEIELHYETLLRQNAPLVPTSAIPSLKSIVNEALLGMMERSADRSTGIGWILVHMQDLEEAIDAFQEAHEVTRQLITVYDGQSPFVRNAIIDRLVDNTNAVMDEYEAFFTAERRAELETLVAAADEQREEVDLDTLKANLTEIANAMQTRMQDRWEGDSALRRMASELKFIFGSCDPTQPHRLLSDEYFGDLPVAARIVEEGDDAEYCAR